MSAEESTLASILGLNELDEVQLMAEGQPKGYSMINGAKYNFYQVPLAQAFGGVLRLHWSKARSRLH